MVASRGSLFGESEGTETTETRVERRSVPQFVESTAVKGGSARESSILQEAVAGMRKTSLKEVAIGRPGVRREIDGGKAIGIRFTTIRVIDEDGSLALEWGSWTRNPAGVYWVRRDLANCSPIRQSEAPGTPKPPACPE